MTNEAFCNLFGNSKVLTMADLIPKMNVATQTIRNHLKKVGALTSYNKNGMHYTLPSTPHFNENGIWSEDGVCFSQRGTLKDTFVHIITSSDKGVTSAQMTEILLLPADNIINIYRHLPEIQRERINGRYVYFSSNKDIYAIQREARIACEDLIEDEALVNNANIAVSLRDEDGIKVLVDKIKNPTKEPIEISKTLSKENPAITEEAVTVFLEKNLLVEAPEFSLVEKVTEMTKKCTDALLAKNLFPTPPTITFDPRQEDHALEEYSVEKSSSKTVYTLHQGAFIARKIMISTDNGSVGSQKLLSLVAPGCQYGYDVIDAIGRMTYNEHKQASEIKLWLASKNIDISESEIDILKDKYIVYLSIIHDQSTSKIVEMMNRNGGYILHLDGMGSKGGERLMTGIDSLSNTVLNNAKIGSENSEEIIPFLKVIDERYGKPLCIVQDMGQGIMNAVKDVFKEIPIYICHFHFLRDIGKDLLKPNYDTITKRLTHFGFLTKLRAVRTSLKDSVEQNPDAIEKFYDSIVDHKKIKNGGPTVLNVMLYTLLEWILSWDDESAGYGFPFDRPKYDLAVRLSEAWVNLCDFPEKIITQDPILKKHYDRVKAIIVDIVNDKELQDAVKSIVPEIVVFDKLRDAMRIAPKSGENGLNDNNDSIEIKTIESSVTKFIHGPEVLAEFSTESRKQKFLCQLKKYWSQLFSDPITVMVDGQKRQITPQRTNNIMERFFRDLSRGSNRKSGCDNIGRMLDAMVPDMPLVRNFQNQNYLDATVGTKSLPQMFSEIDPTIVKEKMKKLNVNPEKINNKIKKCIEADFFIKTMSSVTKKLIHN